MPSSPHIPHLNHLPTRPSPHKLGHLPPLPPIQRPLLLITARITIRTHSPLPPSRPHIPPTSTATAHTEMNQEPENAKRRPSPHKAKHLLADTSADI